ncbi:hypothetical protein NO1_1605 [Candidatus Termititenax aidoneus]|uniref:Uncharacterized protein n=1 Tax=Termititenax aidoneus TaxID=2218524 RepID=A0A388TEM1_TERA1|nr:hypothetical protein NO1_1605 [Candidatus Termititenax aidoneus]
MRSLKLFSALILFCVLSVFVNAAVYSNNTISFQGFLRDEAKDPLTGAVAMDFNFYDGSLRKFTVSVRDVVVFNGNYTAKINLSSTNIDTIKSAADLWIEVVVDTKPMTPKIQMTAAPYAMLVKGLKYDVKNDTVILGYPNIVTANSDSAGGLVMQGKMLIGTDDRGRSIDVNGEVRVEGNVTTNTLTGTAVYGAIWN